MKNYFALTKPTIMLLVIVTGATALFIEGSLLSQPWKFLLVLLGLYLSGGSANALNQYFERDIDARMSRTSKRRPLPQQKVNPTAALIFAITIGTGGVLILGIVFNWLTGLLALGNIVFYSVIYTLLLKPRTHQNIVIGGIAGAMAPVGAWAAATGQTHLVPWLLFLIVFLWTPPHFWSLALVYKDDYKKIGYPMLPVVKGDDYTLRQIITYSLLLLGSTLMLALLIHSRMYWLAGILCNYYLIKKVLQANKIRTEKGYRQVFGYSIVYLFGIFGALLMDGILNYILK
jgi:protoheme IX farnesyltransferase